MMKNPAAETTGYQNQKLEYGVIPAKQESRLRPRENGWVGKALASIKTGD